MAAASSGARSAASAAVVTRIAGGDPRRNRLPGATSHAARKRAPTVAASSSTGIQQLSPLGPRADHAPFAKRLEQRHPPGVVAAHRPMQLGVDLGVLPQLEEQALDEMAHPSGAEGQPGVDPADGRLVSGDDRDAKVGTVGLRRRSQEGPVTRAADDRPEGRSDDAVAVVVLEDGYLGVGAEQGAQLAAAALADRRAGRDSERGRSARRLGCPGRGPVPGRRGPAPRRRPRPERGRSPRR